MPKRETDESSPRVLQAAFLIRCWREANIWRYSVEDVASRRRRRYECLEELLAAIKARLLDITKD